MTHAVTVRLECEDGDFVGTAVIQMPDTIPLLLSWNSRVFALHEDLTYREVESCHVVPLEAVR